jgi:hypothetical protein
LGYWFDPPSRHRYCRMTQLEIRYGGVYEIHKFLSGNIES